MPSKRSLQLLLAQELIQWILCFELVQFKMEPMTTGFLDSNVIPGPAGITSAKFTIQCASKCSENHDCNGYGFLDGVCKLAKFDHLELPRPDPGSPGTQVPTLPDWVDIDNLL